VPLHTVVLIVSTMKFDSSFIRPDKSRKVMCRNYS